LSKIIPNRIITGDDLSAYQRWEVPLMQADIPPAPVQPLPTADQIEQIQKQAYEEGYAQGLQQGREKGHIAGLAEMQAQAQRLDQLLNTLGVPLAQLDEDVEKELVSLSIAIARQIVRREIKTDPGQIVAVVREGVASLPLASRNIHLHLHPEDAALVRAALSLTEGDKIWRIVEDPVLTRGGCRVVTDTSQIDASLDSRIAAIAASILGGARGYENPGH